MKIMANNETVIGLCILYIIKENGSYAHIKLTVGATAMFTPLLQHIIIQKQKQKN